MHHPNITSATVSQPISNPEMEGQLRYAAQNGNEAVVAMLLEAGADKEAKDYVRDERGGGGGGVRGIRCV